MESKRRVAVVWDDDPEYLLPPLPTVAAAVAPSSGGNSSGDDNEPSPPEDGGDAAVSMPGPSSPSLSSISSTVVVAHVPPMSRLKRKRKRERPQYRTIPRRVGRECGRHDDDSLITIESLGAALAASQDELRTQYGAACKTGCLTRFELMERRHAVFLLPDYLDRFHSADGGLTNMPHIMTVVCVSHDMPGLETQFVWPWKAHAVIPRFPKAHSYTYQKHYVSPRLSRDLNRDRSLIVTSCKNFVWIETLAGRNRKEQSNPRMPQKYALMTYGAAYEIHAPLGMSIQEVRIDATSHKITKAMTSANLPPRMTCPLHHIGVPQRRRDIHIMSMEVADRISNAIHSSTSLCRGGAVFECLPFAAFGPLAIGPASEQSSLPLMAPKSPATLPPPAPLPVAPAVMSVPTSPIIYMPPSPPLNPWQRQRQQPPRKIAHSPLRMPPTPVFYSQPPPSLSSTNLVMALPSAPGAAAAAVVDAAPVPTQCSCTTCASSSSSSLVSSSFDVSSFFVTAAAQPPPRLPSPVPSLFTVPFSPPRLPSPSSLSSLSSSSPSRGSSIPASDDIGPLPDLDWTNDPSLDAITQPLHLGGGGGDAPTLGDLFAQDTLFFTAFPLESELMS